MSAKIVRKERALRLEKYFEIQKSPLQNYAKDFIQISDEYDLDWTLLAAIAGQESSLGKHICGPYNAWGWGSPCWGFTSWKEGIRTVGKAIATGKTYADYQRSHTLTSLAEKYNGGDKKAWVSGVSHFQKQIENIELK
jgi:hypothetical protein